MNSHCLPHFKKAKGQVSKVEDRGLEPLKNKNVTTINQTSYELSTSPRAANALHSECPSCPGLAAIDANLQQVINAWKNLRPEIKNAITGLVQSQQPLK